MKPEIDKGKKAMDSYLRYSGLGFQLAGTVAVGVFIGYELDKWFKTAPLFTLGCSIIFMVAALYLTFKDLVRKK